MKKEATCTIHTCDGCGTGAIQVNGEDMPNGFYLQVFEVHPGGASAGDLFVCSTRCLSKAFKRRTELWDSNRMDEN